MSIEDATLLEGFVAGDEGRTRELLERLLPAIEGCLRRRWPALEGSHRDIVGACGVVLIQWRAEFREGRRSKLRLDEPLTVLADRLANQEARKIRLWHRRSIALTESLAARQTLPETSTPEGAMLDAEERSRIDETLVRLPLSAEQTVRAQLRHDAGEGPPLHVALDCSPGAARVRLTRAHQALVGLVLQRGRR